MHAKACSADVVVAAATVIIPLCVKRKKQLGERSMILHYDWFLHMDPGKERTARANRIEESLSARRADFSELKRNLRRITLSPASLAFTHQHLLQLHGVNSIGSDALARHQNKQILTLSVRSHCSSSETNRVQQYTD